MHAARPIGRNQTSLTNLALAPTVHRGDETNCPASRDVGSQASKFFSTEKQGDGTEVTEKDSMALRAVFDRAFARSAKFLSPPCPRTSSLLLRVEKLASLLWTGSHNPASVGIGRPTRRRLHLARRRTMSGPGGSPRKSMCYRRFRGKSPQPAGIFEVSSAGHAAGRHLCRWVGLASK